MCSIEAENAAEEEKHAEDRKEPRDHGLLRLGKPDGRDPKVCRHIVVEKVAEDKNIKGQHKAAQGQYEKFLFLFFHRAKPFSSINTYYSLFLCSVAVNKILKIFAVS